MDQTKIHHYGDELYEALLARRPLEPITSRESEISIEDAYHIQQRMIARRLEQGETVVGKKVGATSKAVQQMLNVHQPDFGYLLSGMTYAQGEAIPMDSLIQPRAEGEIAFILKRDLMGPGVTTAAVLSAT